MDKVFTTRLKNVVMCIFLLFSYLTFFMWGFEKGHRDGYFVGATEVLIGKTNIIDLCSDYPECWENIQEKLCK